MPTIVDFHRRFATSYEQRCVNVFVSPRSLEAFNALSSTEQDLCLSANVFSRQQCEDPVQPAERGGVVLPF